MHTYVVRNILATNVEQSAGEVAIRHLQTVVDSPDSRTKAVADTRETSAGRSVRLEHHELLPKLLGNARRVQIGFDEILTRGVGEIIREDSLRIFDGSEGAVREFGRTVLVGVTANNC